MKKYKCLNIGNCENANEGKIFEIAEGEPIECKKCPGGHGTMVVEVKEKNWKALIIAAVVLLLVGGAAGVYFGIIKPSQEKKAEQARLEAAAIEKARQDSIAAVKAFNDSVEQAKARSEAEEAEAAAIEKARQDSIAQALQDSIEQVRRDSIEKARQDSIEKAKRPVVTQKNPSWGKYDGPRDSNGRPHGNGVLRITRSTTINGQTAQPGERIEGVFRNGYVNMATWYKKDGNTVVVKDLKVY